MRCDKPLEVLQAGLCDTIMKSPHRLNYLLLHLSATLHWEVGEKVVRDGNECHLWPPLEPIHRAAGDEARELESTTTELLSHLQQQVKVVHIRASEWC